MIRYFFYQKHPFHQGEDRLGELGLEEENLAEHMSVDSRPASQLGTARAPLIINPVLAELLEQDKKNPDPIDVSEVCVLLHRRERFVHTDVNQ